MLAEGRPNHAVAFPGDRGTADMMRRCIEAGIQPVLGAFDDQPQKGAPLKEMNR